MRARLFCLESERTNDEPREVVGRWMVQKYGIYVLCLRIIVGTEVVLVYCIHIQKSELIYKRISAELEMPRNE